MRGLIIVVLDWLDDRVDHRLGPLCHYVTRSKWWRPYVWCPRCGSMFGSAGGWASCACVTRGYDGAEVDE